MNENQKIVTPEKVVWRRRKGNTVCKNVGYLCWNLRPWSSYEYIAPELFLLLMTSLFTFPYHFLSFSCYWRPPVPYIYLTLPHISLPFVTLHLTLPYLISYLSLPYILPYLTYVLPFVTLPYLTSYLTLLLTLPYHISYLTFCLALPYILTYLTSYLTFCITLPYLMSYLTLLLTLP